MDERFKGLKKAELVKLATGYCRHRHRYTEHVNCFWAESQIQRERVAFFDIESSNLNADFGIILSYCLKELDGPIIERVIRPGELRSETSDKALVRHLLNSLRKFNRIITWYGSRFDIPYVRARAFRHDLEFPKYGEIFHTDLWEVSRRKLKIHSNRLQATCDFLGIPAKDHPLHGGMWTKALTGDKPSLQYILVHNREDVVSLEKLWKLYHGHYKVRATAA